MDALSGEETIKTVLSPLWKRVYSRRKEYGKCPKISNTKVTDKMTYANSTDPDQTALKGAVWPGSTAFAIPLF